jgi:hypothetical protein
MKGEKLAVQIDMELKRRRALPTLSSFLLLSSRSLSLSIALSLCVCWRRRFRLDLTRVRANVKRFPGARTRAIYFNFCATAFRH